MQGILVSGHPVVDLVVEPFCLGVCDFGKPDGHGEIGVKALDSFVNLYMCML